MDTELESYGKHDNTQYLQLVPAAGAKWPARHICTNSHPIIITQKKYIHLLLYYCYFFCSSLASYSNCTIRPNFCCCCCFRYKLSVLKTNIIDVLHKEQFSFVCRSCYNGQMYPWISWILQVRGFPSLWYISADSAFSFRDFPSLTQYLY